MRFPKSHAAKQAWCGWYRDSVPTPGGLARKAQLPGKRIELADGNEWLVPIARDAGGMCSLPVSFDLDEETGEWVGNKVQPKFQKIWEHAVEYYSTMMLAIVNTPEGETPSWLIPNYETLVVDALAVNYRVSARELSSLGVLVSGIAGTIADVLIDIEGWADLQKKTVNDTGSGSAG